MKPPLRVHSILPLSAMSYSREPGSIFEQRNVRGCGASIYMVPVLNEGWFFSAGRRACGERYMLRGQVAPMQPDECKESDDERREECEGFHRTAFENLSTEAMHSS